MNLYVISAVAGPSAASILDAGEVVKKFIYGAVGGAGTVAGTAAANQIIDSNKPYVVFWQVRGNDGLLYNVCQNMQNGRPISQPYWCP
jgi:hypothetical protein